MWISLLLTFLERDLSGERTLPRLYGKFIYRDIYLSCQSV